MATKGTKNSQNNVELGVTLSQDTINNLSKGLSTIQRMFTASFSHMNNVFKSFNSAVSKMSGAETNPQDEMKKLQDDITGYEAALSKYYQRRDAYQEKLNNGEDQEKYSKALEKNRVSIMRLEAQLANAQLKLRDFGVTTQDTSKKIEESSEKIDKSNKKLQASNEDTADSFTLVNYTALGLFRRLIRWGTRAFSALASAGSDYMEINSRFNRILGEGADIAENSAKRIANAYGRDLTEVKGYFTSIYTILRNSNLELSTAIGLSANLTAVANELASVWDTDVDQAINAVISGLQGLPKAMKRYGVYLTQSEIKEYLVEAGFLAEDYAGKLGSGERALATYLKVMKDSGYAIHDFANTQASVANQLRILGSSFTGLQRSLGSMMNTVLSPILQVFNYILKIVASLANELNNLPEPLKFIVGIFTSFITLTPIVVGGFVVLSYFGKIWKNQLTEIATKTAEATGATKLMNKAMLSLAKNFKKIILWGSILFLFISSIASLYKEVEEGSNGVEDGFENATNSANDFKRALSGFDDVNVLSFSDKAQENIEGLDFGDTDIDKLNETLNSMLENTSGIADIAKNMEWLNGVIIAVTGSMLTFKAIDLATKVVSWVKSIGFISNALIKLKAYMVAGTLSGNKFIVFLRTFGNTLRYVSAAAGFIVAIGLAIEQIVNLWKSSEPTWKKIIGTILGVVFAIGTLATAIGIMTKNMGMVARGATAMGIAASGYAGVMAITTNNEQKLATGGVAVGATRAVIGEGIYDEAVIPLGQSPQFDSMKSDIAGAVVEGLSGANLSNGQPINITINVDEDYIYKAYNRQAKLYGKR